MIRVVPHIYTDGTDTFIGKLSWDDQTDHQRPGILIAPAFGGLGPFEEERARELAALGYAVLAVDYYGDGKRAADEAEAFALMGQLEADRPLLARRMNAALETLKAQELVDANRVGAMGYCFGGKCVLDLARSGAQFEAVVSFHGVYNPPGAERRKIAPSALVLHGWEDPLAQPSQLMELTAELTETCDDWQVLAFGHTGHAFTNPNARAPEAGMVYSEDATRRSWRAMTDFFEEKLGA